jgi:hypothetical protein
VPTTQAKHTFQVTMTPTAKTNNFQVILADVNDAEKERSIGVINTG